jgi:4-amino-4-deoxy-L-arabinose transferase-like glycosyltransferase
MNLRAIMKIVLNRKWAFPSLYGILALAIMLLMTSGGMGVSVDSERYLITANALSHLDFETAFRISLPHSPLFYPLSIALVQILGLAQGVGAARIVSVLSFVVSAMVLFFLGLQIQGKATAHTVSLSWIAFAPLLYAFSYCWSETVYIALSLLFFLSLALFLKAPIGKETRYLVMCSIFAGLGFITRFMGIALIGAGILALVFLVKRERTSIKLKQITIFGLVASLPMLINLMVPFLFYSLPSRENAPAGLSFFGQTGSFFVTVYRDFLSIHLNFDNYLFVYSPAPWLAFFESRLLWFAIIILLCLLAFLFGLIRLLRLSSSFRTSLRPQAAMAIYCALYGILIVVITWRIAVDPIGSRFVMPLYPFIMILVFSCLFLVRQELMQRKLKRAFISLAVLGTLLFWSIQLSSVFNIYRRISTGSFPAMEQPGNHNRPSLKYLQENLTPANVILSNIPDKLFFIWPRDNIYWSLSQLDFLTRQNSGMLTDSLVYVLLCTKDRDINPVMMEMEGGTPSLRPIHLLSENEQNQFVEGYLTSRKFSYREVVLGHDCIYRLGSAGGVKDP